MMDAKVLSAAVLGAALLSSTVLADPTETARAAGKDATWLFIQPAEKLQFDGTPLTLSGVSPSTIMFTDRPARVAEGIPTATLLKNCTGRCGSGS